MIRPFQTADLNEVAEIWLDTNVKTHHFIPAQYWHNHFAIVKDLLLQAEIYVYENEKNKQIQGFIGLNEDYIEGIFVRSEARSKGIGKQLLDFVKGIKPELHLRVYVKNARAVSFYQREIFRIRCEDTDEDTGEKEFVMVWKREIDR